MKDLWKSYDDEIDDEHLKEVLSVLLRCLVYKKNSVRLGTLDNLNQMSESRMRSLFTCENFVSILYNHSSLHSLQTFSFVFKHPFLLSYF